MAELGYHRSGKKCKEKFENVYKYHKRTKEGRVGKSDGKTYRFFDQLEALEQHHSNSPSSALPPLPAPPRAPPQGAAQVAVPVTMVMPAGVTVPSSPHPINVVHVAPAPSSISPQPQQPQHQSVSNNPTNANQVAQTQGGVQGQQQPTMPTHPSPIQMEHSPPSESPSATPSSSSSTSSDEEVMGRRKRKRKWKDFFERLMKDVIDKQEDLQKRFLEAVEKREHDRMAREEAWKMQEIARLNREHEILVQERSMAATKDAALISFLQKLSEQQHIPVQLPTQLQTQSQPQTQPQPLVVPSTTGTQPQQAQPQPQPQPQPQTQSQAQVHHNLVPVVPPPLPQPQPLTQLPPQQQVPAGQTQLVLSNNVDLQKTNNGNGTRGEVQNPLPPSSSRWPKAEVQALINLRTSLDQKYQESGPKGPLWEEISASMRKLGYNRNAKRCKEKWENINKYFKKVKESNKRRPEDSKTCPYFHQLDALYREKNKVDPNTNTNTTTTTTTTTVTSSYGHPSSNVNLGPIMAQPQQQWATPGSDKADHDESDDEGDEDDDDDDQGSGYEIVANNPTTSATNANINVNSNAGSMSTTATTATTTATAE